MYTLNRMGCLEIAQQRVGLTLHGPLRGCFRDRSSESGKNPRNPCLPRLHAVQVHCPRYLVGQRTPKREILLVSLGLGAGAPFQVHLRRADAACILWPPNATDSLSFVHPYSHPPPLSARGTTTSIIRFPSPWFRHLRA